MLATWHQTPLAPLLDKNLKVEKKVRKVKKEKVLVLLKSQECPIPQPWATQRPVVR